VKFIAQVFRQLNFDKYAKIEGQPSIWHSAILDLKVLLTPLLFIILPAISYGQGAFRYQPTSPSDQIIKTYREFSLSYSDDYKQPVWVAYELTRKELQKAARRSNHFRIDKSIGTQWASLEDYEGSGYHRGHICRANYCKSSKQAYKESFYLSNISPQLPDFNSGGGNWYNLEILEENYALVKKSIYAVSGPVFRDNIGVIGKGRIIVPGYFYKALLCPDLEHAIGFLLPHNEDKVKNLLQFAVTIDSLEAFTGIDFFFELEDDAEELLENTIDFSCWTPPAKNELEQVKKPGPMSDEHPLMRCKAIAQGTGKRCKRNTGNESGFCWQHE
jgi:endonuclease G